MGNENKGFASMDEQKIKDIAKKGGDTRKDQLGPEGYAEMGHKGGKAKKDDSEDEED